MASKSTQKSAYFDLPDQVLDVVLDLICFGPDDGYQLSAEFHGRLGPICGPKAPPAERDVRLYGLAQTAVFLGKWGPKR